MNLFEEFEKKILHFCQKPGRYIGNEILSTKKDWNKASLKWGLFYPDIYDLGISNLGIITLYRILNSYSHILAERFYMPAFDIIETMEKENIPPLSLENKRQPKEFDIIGITLPYELTVTNILKFLKLADINLIRNDTDFPIIIGGGSMAYNPLPLMPFFDAFVIGDGEDILIPISNIVLEYKDNKPKILEELARLEGVFVPKVHNTEKDIIKRIFVKNLNSYEPPLPIVPIVEATFERLSLEVARGCTRGCRFCFSGITTRPYRERDVKHIIEFIEYASKKTGFDEFSPSSLSITDFSCFNNLFTNLYNYTKANNIALSLPSLRVGSINKDVAERISSFRKTGFTVAPETAPSLQKAVNKNVDFDTMEKDIETAFSMGWRNIKLYFMIGLPDEKEQDLYEISYFINHILKNSKHLKPHITLSFSNFVPKPHTPLQWSKMDNINEIISKQSILKDLFYPKKNVYLKLHNPYMSLLECVISRGDKETAKIIFNAYEEGCIFDAWDDKFSFQKWQNASEKTGIDFERYLSEKPLEEKLPWEFIDIGIKKSFLIQEYEKYKKGISTPDCRFNGCYDCGICDFSSIKHLFSKPYELYINNKTKKEALGKKEYILVYEKLGPMKYLGNLDILRLWHRLLRIAEANLEYSKGHNPQPLIDGGWALPLGMESYCEILKFKGFINDNDAFLNLLKNTLPEGMTIVDFFEYEGKHPIDLYANTFEFFCLTKPNKYFSPEKYDFDNLVIPVLKRDGSKKELPVFEQLISYEPKDNCFYFQMTMKQGGIKPIDFASMIAGRKVSPFEMKKIIAFCEGGKIFGKRINC